MSCLSLWYAAGEPLSRASLSEENSQSCSAETAASLLHDVGALPYCESSITLGDHAACAETYGGMFLVGKMVGSLWSQTQAAESHAMSKEL